MITHINKIEHIKEVVKFVENSGYTINIHTNNKLIMEIGTDRPDFLSKNTIGNVKIHYINSTKLMAKIGIELLR
ncbi:hypothetical protein [Methanococcus aeolicus]|jgi:hypothetical protein|uniref:Uncharacterized protein n=1 Tax=Methanococcus aeolicus (strain ATCC BAA-1280 / DSM 17508 / OCM 812 / Nankai-3) TaxID=419665 RepID=A6UWU1_META3|nr:hypothetical protein [Methanococcus aeolicus]ABR56963.1 conserved hypothetical protein [Methanococcus aeolicus Nankai-3]UXM84960.1 hypothetical protein N6C89_01385 [Methanococcus aeolicus]